MSTDFTTVVVAGVSVVGTLGGAFLTQHAGFRNKQLELKSQRAEAATQADATRRAERQELYADLNATARSYRTACYDCVQGLTVDDQRRPIELDARLAEGMRAARTAFRDVYARAQMVLAEPTLVVASEVNACLGFGYAIVRRLVTTGSGGPDQAGQPSFELRLGKASNWFDGPSSDSVWLLRRALRAELGVTEWPENIVAESSRLRLARHAAKEALERAPRE